MLHGINEESDWEKHWVAEGLGVNFQAISLNLKRA